MRKITGSVTINFTIDYDALFTESEDRTLECMKCVVDDTILNSLELAFDHAIDGVPIDYDYNDADIKVDSGLI